MTQEWHSPRDKMPPQDVVVDTLNSHGETVQLLLHGSLWFVPDMSMYVYYEPTFWRAKKASSKHE